MAIAVNPNIPDGQRLSQWERIADTFLAPTKTFQDIRVNASWWLPFVLGIVVSFLFVSSVDRRIGFEQVAQANINRSAGAQEKMSSMPDAQRERTIHMVATSTRVVSYAYPCFALLVALVGAGILMVSFNLGMGAHASFKQYFAVWFYAGLPFLIKYIVAAIAIVAGAGGAQFDMQNPVGTNIGWYLSTDSSLWIRTLLSSADLFTIWVVVLLIVGCSTIAQVKRSSAAWIVIGWWLLTVLGSTVTAAIQG